MALSLRDISLMEGGELPHVFFNPFYPLQEKHMWFVVVHYANSV